jgi:hypothetical protein
MRDITVDSVAVIRALRPAATWVVSDNLVHAVLDTDDDE